MNFLQEFDKIMEGSMNIAIATSQNNVPNVRVVTYYWDSQNKGVVYFSTFRQSPKTMEFSQNNKVAFITVQDTPGAAFVRVTSAIVQKSNLTVDDIKDRFIKKFPGFASMVEQAGPMLDIYEIHFNEVNVTSNFKTGAVTL